MMNYVIFLLLAMLGSIHILLLNFFLKLFYLKMHIELGFDGVDFHL